MLLVSTTSPFENVDEAIESETMVGRYADARAADLWALTVVDRPTPKISSGESSSRGPIGAFSTHLKGGFYRMAAVWLDRRSELRSSPVMGFEARLRRP